MGDPTVLGVSTGVRKIIAWAVSVDQKFDLRIGEAPVPQAW